MTSTTTFGTIITRNGRFGPYWTLVGMGNTAQAAIDDAGPAINEFGVICVKTRVLEEDDDMLIEKYWENR